MTEDREETLEELLKQNAELKENIQRLEQQRKALEKDVHRLQLERDVLEKAGEILKKEEGVNLNHLSNREKGECPKEVYYGIIGNMRKQRVEAWKKCPKCGKEEGQIKAGYNASGTQRCKCKECGIYYTINPKQHEYPEETRGLAIKMYYGGISGRGVGKILGMNKSNVMYWIKKGR